MSNPRSWTSASPLRPGLMGATIDASVHVQARCPDLLTPTDLLFLEPRCLLVEDPFAAWLRSWPAITRVAEGIDQLMRNKCFYNGSKGGCRWGKIKDEVQFCDAVPVSQFWHPSTACSRRRPFQHVPCSPWPGDTYLRLCVVVEEIVVMQRVALLIGSMCTIGVRIISLEVVLHASC